ncbi:MAG: GNAT family N-acetyltransferase [Methylococcaceae bacterium]
MADFFDVQVITLNDLRSDQYGLLISDLADIICEVFSEPPWNESFSAARIMFGLGVEMMRKNAILVIARHKQEGRPIGYMLGQELVVESDDPRDQTFFKISGGYDLDFLANNNQRTFYVGGLGVRSKYRRLGVAEQLSATLILELRRHKFDYRIGRTDLQAYGMRNLYSKQGFKELPVHDVNYPERSYWLLSLN